MQIRFKVHYNAYAGGNRYRQWHKYVFIFLNFIIMSKEIWFAESLKCTDDNEHKQSIDM